MTRLDKFLNFGPFPEGRKIRQRLHQIPRGNGPEIENPVNQAAFRGRDRSGAFAFERDIFKILPGREQLAGIIRSRREKAPHRASSEPEHRLEHEMRQAQRRGEQRQGAHGEATEKRLREKFQAEEIKREKYQKRHAVARVPPFPDKCPGGEGNGEEVCQVGHNDHCQ